MLCLNLEFNIHLNAWIAKLLKICSLIINCLMSHVLVGQFAFQASTCSLDRGHVLDFCIMLIIWGFGRLSPLAHARLNRMSCAPPVSPLQLPRLTQCLYYLPTAVTNLCMPGMHGTQNAQASKLPGWLGWREQVSEMERSLGTSCVAQCENQDWCSPYICLLTSLTCP